MKTNAKKSASSALILPQTIIPKPRKEDIITAMVERARVKHEQAVAEYKEKQEALTAKIEAAAKAAFDRSPPTPKFNISSYRELFNVELEFRVESPLITSLCKQHKELRHPGFFSAPDVRRKIRDGMTGERTNGVQALLNSPDAVKALDASLEHIGM